MKKIAVIYWPKKGNVENTAAKLSAYFDTDSVDVFTISDVETNKLSSYDLLIFGGSTVGADNWKDAHTSKWYSFFKDLKAVDLTNIPVAIYGLGDQILYPENFVDGIAIIQKELLDAGAKVIGAWPVEGYEHTGSKSQVGDYFIGLALDDDQQPERSDERIAKWVNILKSEAGF